MEDKANSKIPTESSAARRAMGRREMVSRLLGGAGLSYAAPLVASAHPIRRHLADPATLAQADASAAQPHWEPIFLDAHQTATFEVLAERIVPGSGEAKVTPFVDLLLSVDTQDNQKKFLASLGAFEAESIRRYSRPFKELKEAEQNELLTAASTSDHDAKGNGEAKGLEMNGHFQNLKGWVTGAYYSSETGMKELGWTGQVIFSSFPGCDHPEGHQ